MTANPDPSGEDIDTVAFGDLLENLARELHDASQSCVALQWSISALLDKVNHPDLAAEIHMLQDIDRLQQTLDDLSAALRVGASVSGQSRVSRLEAGQSIRLDSLRQRLGLANAPLLVSPGADQEASDEDDITWL